MFFFFLPRLVEASSLFSLVCFRPGLVEAQQPFLYLVSPLSVLCCRSLLLFTASDQKFHQQGALYRYLEHVEVFLIQVTADLCLFACTHGG